MENEFEVPENLGALRDEVLRELEQKGTEAFNALSASADLSDEAIEKLEAIAASVDAVKAEIASRKARIEKLANLKGRMAPEVEAPVVEPVVAAAVEEEVAEEAPAALAASAAEETPDPIVKVSERNAIPEASPALVITAAADIPGFSAGSPLHDRQALATAMHKKALSLRDHSGNVPIATIELPVADGYDLVGMSQYERNEAIIEMSGAQSLENSLAAAGGWCAPSEIMYDFFNLECATASTLRLPTFRADRGGVRWPISTPLPAFTLPIAAQTNVDWVHTEANDIAGATKPCIEIPCPDFRECRLDAHGICVTGGNLMDRAYPENHNRFLNQVFLAHERNENLRKLAVLEAGSVNVTLGSTFGTGSAILNAVLLQAADYRDKFRMCDDALLEAVFPVWTRDVIRADVARQQGTLNGIGGLPTNADIDAWFAAARVSAQWVNDWQPIAGDPALLFPQEVFFLLYAPGTWVEFNGGTLDLGVVRDSVLNSTNDFTAAWTETFYCIGLRGYESRRVRVEICPDGSVGSRVDILCSVES